MTDEKNEDDYDPFEHRHPAHPTNNFESWHHIIKAILGTGVLAMPHGFKNVGMLMGVVVSLINGGLCTYGIHLLVRSQYLLCKQIKVGAQTYTESMITACELGPGGSKKFSKYAGGITDAIMIIYQIGVCSVYVFFVAKNMKYVCDEFLSNDVSLEMYMAILFIPVFLINSFRNLKLLVPLSLLANTITIVTIAVVFYFLFEGGFPPISERIIYGRPERLPLFIGTTNYAFQSVGVVTVVEYNMKTPKQFTGYFGVYNRALAFLVILYIPFGFLGYWKYGEETRASVTLNLPQKHILTKVINSSYAFATFISYGLNAYVPIDLIWNFYIGKYVKDTRWSIVWEFLLRLGMVLSSFVLPVTVPYLGLFISFLGAITVSCLVYIFPGWMDICARYPNNNYGRRKWRVWKDILFIIYGLVGMVIGVGLVSAEVYQLFHGERDLVEE